MDNIKDVAEAINSLSKVITNNVKAMDEEDKPKDKKQKDQYSTEDEARERAKEIGCVGIHSMMDNGKRIYMPCGSHDAYRSYGKR